MKVLLTTLGQISLVIIIMGLIFYTGYIVLEETERQVNIIMPFCSDKEGVFNTEYGLLNCTKINNEGIEALAITV